MPRLFCTEQASIAGWHHGGSFYHKHNRAHGSASPVQRAARNKQALARRKLYRSIFQVQEKAALQDEKELILQVMLVPVEFALEYAKPDNAVIYQAKRLIPPAVGAFVGKPPHVHKV